MPTWPLPWRTPRGPPPPAPLDAVALARDAAWLLALAALVPALRYVLHVLVYEPVARAVLAVPAPKAAVRGARDAVRERRVCKFCESAWKLTVYTALLAAGVTPLAGAPWLTAAPDALWPGWPRHAVPARLSVYFAAEAAFYTASLGMLLWWEVRRADFGAMLAHHVATVTLIVGAHALHYHRVGAIVMLLHDPSDVLLEAAKLASYAGWEGAAAALFAALAASWAALRLGCLPRVVVSVWRDAPAMLGGPPAGSRPLALALCVLVGLHVYWFALIVRVAWHQATGRGLRDAREADDDDCEVAAAGRGRAAANAPASAPGSPGTHVSLRPRRRR